MGVIFTGPPRWFTTGEWGLFRTALPKRPLQKTNLNCDAMWAFPQLVAECTESFASTVKEQVTSGLRLFKIMDTTQGLRQRNHALWRRGKATHHGQTSPSTWRHCSRTSSTQLSHCRLERATRHCQSSSNNILKSMLISVVIFDDAPPRTQLFPGACEGAFCKIRMLQVVEIHEGYNVKGSSIIDRLSNQFRLWILLSWSPRLISSSLSHSSSTAAFASGIFIAFLMEMELCTDPSWNSDAYPLSKTWPCGIDTLVLHVPSCCWLTWLQDSVSSSKSTQLRILPDISLWDTWKCRESARYGHGFSIILRISSSKPVMEKDQHEKHWPVDIRTDKSRKSSHSWHRTWSVGMSSSSSLTVTHQLDDLKRRREQSARAPELSLQDEGQLSS